MESAPVYTPDEGPDILCYGPGGLFAMRADAEMYEAGHGWRRTDDRDYSLLVYLSDGFTGANWSSPVTVSRSGRGPACS